MKFIITVRKYFLLPCSLVLMLTAIPIISHAQKIIDTSSPQDPLIAPTIVVSPTKVEPTCHSYTGCGVVIEKKYSTYHYYKPKRRCVYHCCVYHRPC